MNAFASPVLAAGIMDLNPGLTLWTAITFLVLIFVLWKFAFGPISKMLVERETTIRDSIDSARKEREEAISEATVKLVVDDMPAGSELQQN